ncbi:MAG TPA: hypothetical protein VD833_16850 [Vicinamibacterales bacterium]|nr:hypothetical protein [Vicinamibacterales bacterium]
MAIPLASLAFVAVLQAGPVILSSDDIGDNYYDAVPAELRQQITWLGLFIKEPKADENTAESRLEAAQVGFAPHKAAGTTVYRLVTTPQGAELLIAGVPGLSAGAATTADRFIDLGGEKRTADIRLGTRLYRIRLHSEDPNYCDAVIVLTEADRIQKLFDAAESGATNDLGLVVSCDEPHFRIHWAGDLDRDGRLDMLVTFSRKYSYHPRQLMLSSGAGPGELIAEVARYDRFAQ